MKDQIIHVLLIENDFKDISYIKDLMTEVVREVKLIITTVRSLAEALGILAQHTFDIVLLDVMLHDCKGIETFQHVHGNSPDIPVVILTGLDDSNVALQAVSEGAQDYLSKTGLSSRLLLRSIRYAIERQKLVLKLKQALNEVRTLQGFLPICANCKKIRNDKGYWQAVEVYVQEHSDAQFSHGICPDCLRKLYPEFADSIIESNRSRN
ncbi:MAG: response regulator [Desulfomonilaceae bacterium]